METVIPFHTPIWVANTNLNMDGAVKKCFEMEKLGGVTKSNAGGYQSHTMFEKEFSTLFGEIYKFILEQVEIVGRKTQSKYLFGNAWCNINRKNHYNNRHVHAGSSISGSIYLKTSENSGKITFYNPTASEHYNLNDGVDGFSGTYWFTPTVGTLLLFPSYLPHQVDMNPTDEPRVSIAFNFYRSL